MTTTRPRRHRTPAGVAVRVAAVGLIERMLDGGGSLTRLLPDAQAELPAADRALLQAYVFGLSRWGQQLAAVLDTLLERPLKKKDRDVGVLLQLGLFQLLHTRTPTHAAVDATVAASVALDKPWARGLVNAVLRNADRRRDSLLGTLDEAARLSHPVWLLDSLRSDWPEDWRAIADSNNVQAPMVLRVNLAVGSRRSYADRLAAAGLGSVPLDEQQAALVLDSPVGVDRLPGFFDGAVSVQDGAAQRAVDCLRDGAAAGKRLLDACAAPGGKTAQALESGHFAEVVALDRDPGRLVRVGETIDRLKLGSRMTLRAAVDAADTGSWWDGIPFDVILLDAPCTGSGVIRRHPDIKLLRRASDVAPLVAEQRRLLDALWPTLAPGGTCLYATCSVLRAEGEAQIAAWLSDKSDAERIIEERYLPGGVHDGFYIALLRKSAA